VEGDAADAEHLEPRGRRVHEFGVHLEARVDRHVAAGEQADDLLLGRPDAATLDLREQILVLGIVLRVREELDEGELVRVDLDLALLALAGLHLRDDPLDHDRRGVTRGVWVELGRMRVSTA
jgi:hypothetical protein